MYLYKTLKSGMKSANGDCFGNLKRLEKAKKSQEIVADMLRANKFVIAERKNVSANGMDIVAIKNDVVLNVEVKTVIKNTRSWTIKRPHPASDYIFIVLPCGCIHIEDSSQWIKMCDKNGMRGFSTIIKLHSLLNCTDTTA